MSLKITKTVENCPGKVDLLIAYPTLEISCLNITWMCSSKLIYIDIKHINNIQSIQTTQEFSHSQYCQFTIILLYKSVRYIFSVSLVGGRDDATELSSAECYDPKTNQWFPVVAMNSRRSGVGLAVVNGQLLAVGGFDGTTYLKTIEVFDPVSNQWKLYGGMNYRRLGGGVGVVKLPLSDAFGC